LGPEPSFPNKHGRHDGPVEVFNPNFQQFASSSSTHFPIATSSVMIGPCDHPPGDDLSFVLQSVAALLPNSALYGTDHVSSIQEGRYIRVGFQCGDTAQKLVSHWERVNLLDGSLHELEVKMVAGRDNVLNVLFGLKNG
jgi:hypothetical protein